MAHTQKPDFVFRRNGRVHLNRRGLQFSRLLAAEVCASAVVMLETPCSEVVWRVLATHSMRKFPLHFPSRASPCAIAFQLDSNTLLLSSAIEKLFPSLLPSLEDPGSDIDTRAILTEDLRSFTQQLEENTGIIRYTGAWSHPSITVVINFSVIILYCVANSLKN